MIAIEIQQIHITGVWIYYPGKNVFSALASHEL